jgi:hypothetical protein
MGWKNSNKDDSRLQAEDTSVPLAVICEDRWRSF